MKRILVPTDFSEEANNAIEAAHSLAADTQSDILLFHVVEDPADDAFKTMGEVSYNSMENVYVLKLIEKAKDKLQSIIDDPKFADINISYKVEIGNSFSSIVEQIAEHKSSLIVMGTKGASGLEELLVGSLTDKVVRYSTVPVITVKSCNDLSKIKNIVFATDLKPDQFQVIEDLKLMQKHYDAKLHIIKAYDSIWLKKEEVEERVELFAKEAKLENYSINVVKEADQADAIMDFASDIDADMIAMGTHDRHGLLYLIAGHVTKDVINHAHRPIWTKAIR